MQDAITAIPEDFLRVDLPRVPDWFHEELAKVAVRDGRPVFRLVDGIRELKWRNGKMDVKHLLQADGMACYVPVSKTRFRRRSLRKDGQPKIYRTYEQAVKDRDPYLATDIETATKFHVAAVGRPCWVVEVYISPDEIDYASWLRLRYQHLEKNGVTQQIDVLGPYPRDGWFVA